MGVLFWLNAALGAVLVLCYSYQFVFMIISYAAKKKKFEPKQISNIAVLIAARNERNVIEGLINSIKNQDYPKDKFKIFVIADNCTDDTAQIARAAGAAVYERFNKTEVGKGFALDFLLKKIAEDYGERTFDGYLVFDADNLVAPNYITEINKVFSNGYDVVTSYRNSKNYGDNWLSAGQGLCLMRDNIMLNRARMAIGGCCFVSGTGFIFSSRLCMSLGGGWPFHMLTEDGEFTTYNAIYGTKTGYCDSARFFDDQPARLGQSCAQRLRWCKGYLQIIRGYYSKLIKGIFSKRFISCFDMTMCMAPAYLISIVAVLMNVVGSVISLVSGASWQSVITSLAFGVGVAYLGLYIFGFVLTVSEWRALKASAFKKILYTFTFPIYMFTFIPICFVALLKKNVKWTPIIHENKVSLSDLEGDGKK